MYKLTMIALFFIFMVAQGVFAIGGDYATATYMLVFAMFYYNEFKQND